METPGFQTVKRRKHTRGKETQARKKEFIEDAGESTEYVSGSDTILIRTLCMIKRDSRSGNN